MSQLLRTAKRFVGEYGVFAAFFVFLVVYVVWFVFHGVPLSKNGGDWGAFGDYMGGLLNPLVGFMALIWLKRSVSAQEATLIEVKRTAASQLQALESQKIGDQFFQIMSLHNNVVDRLKGNVTLIGGKQGVLDGDFLLGFYADKVVGELYGVSDFNDARKRCGSVLGRHKKSIDTYLNSLSTVVKFIEGSGKDGDLYADVLRGQISQSQAHLLLYHCIFGYRLDIREQVGKYSLLSNLDDEVFGQAFKYTCESDFGKRFYSKKPSGLAF